MMSWELGRIKATEFVIPATQSAGVATAPDLGDEFMNIV